MANFEIETEDGRKWLVPGANHREAIATFEQAAKGGEENVKQYLAAPPTDKSYKGGILPFSVDAQGNKTFDLSAGITAPLYHLITGGTDATKRVLQGESALSDNVIQDLTRAAPAASPLTPAFRATGGAIPGILDGLRGKAKAPTPTADELKAAGGSGIQQARSMPVDFDPAAIGKWADEQWATLSRDGYSPRNAPKVFEELDALKRQMGAIPPASGGIMPSGTLPERPVVGFDNVVTMRQTFQKHAQSSDPTESGAASRVINALDGFLSSPPRGAVLAGPVEDAARVYAQGRGNYAAGKRSDMLSSREANAESQAAAANSGQNIGNATRQRVRELTKQNDNGDTKADLSGFDPSEVDRLEQIVQGTPMQNSTRYVGNLLGGGGGLGAALTGLAAGGAGLASGAGGATASALTAAPVFIGAASRSISNGLTQRALRAADEAVRQRSPLFQSRQDAMPFENLDPQARELALRMILGAVPNGGGGIFQMLSNPNEITVTKRYRP